jgi:hypothetical protein
MKIVAKQRGSSEYKLFYFFLPFSYLYCLRIYEFNLIDAVKLKQQVIKNKQYEE